MKALALDHSNPVRWSPLFFCLSSGPLKESLSVAQQLRDRAHVLRSRDCRRYQWENGKMSRIEMLESTYSAAPAAGCRTPRPLPGYMRPGGATRKRRHAGDGRLTGCAHQRMRSGSRTVRWPLFEQPRESLPRCNPSTRGASKLVYLSPARHERALEYYEDRPKAVPFRRPRRWSFFGYPSYAPYASWRV